MSIEEGAVCTIAMTAALPWMDPSDPWRPASIRIIHACQPRALRWINLRRRPVAVQRSLRNQCDQRVQRQPDQAADEGAVEADELQVAAEGQFELFDQAAVVPLSDRLRDVPGGAVADAPGDALGTGQQVLVQRVAQGFVALQ